jgi:predicted ATP-grasp superfamily ATP-dependent carboligase
MTEMNVYVEEVRVYNLQEQIKHRAFMLEGILFTAEGCNVDQIERKEVKDLGSDLIRQVQLRPCQKCLQDEN